MTPEAFQLTEHELEPGIREIAVTGELDLAVADRLAEAIDRAEGADALVSLEACEFIDSSGLAVILRAHQLGRESGRRVVIHSPSDPVRRVLEVTGLTGNGFVFADRAAALAALAAG
ncbi:MAG TPA: STAS domain-containing protein [Solirubrobacterales bacterium]|jgi:anti-anti-sigma factor|nr:STAS domain-containing protein [Solirubrobacterales bacterium]